MATAATIAAAAIGAAGSIAGSAISAHGASQAAKSAAGAKGKQIPLPAYATTLNRLVARDTALNIDKVPPSFAEYVDSGGTAKFPFENPGLHPMDLRRLGLIYGGLNRGFHPVPLVSSDAAAQGQLTPEQEKFLRQYIRYNQKHWRDKR